MLSAPHSCGRHKKTRDFFAIAEDDQGRKFLEVEPFGDSHVPICGQLTDLDLTLVIPCKRLLLQGAAGVAASLPALERRLRKYTAPSLLVLDEIGYLPCTRQFADLLYDMISRRRENRSLVLTTNLPFKQWSTVFPGAACVSAMIDRFVQ